MLRPPSAISPGYQVFMLMLCMYSLAILAYQASGPAESTTVVILE
jgi:hypothetical protein